MPFAQNFKGPGRVKRQRLLATAFEASAPVMFGYVPLGMAFGVLFQGLGYSGVYAPLMGLIVFAGAAQFMAVGLLAAHAGLLEVAVSTFLLNSRHMFFGLSLLNRYSAKGLRKFYLIFGLTDETYSLVTVASVPDDQDPLAYYLAVTGLNHGYWVVGCSLGALAGSLVEFDTTGMEFALTALFVVLTLDQWRNIREPFPFLSAAIASVISLLFFEEHMLLAAIGLSIVVLLLNGRRVARGADE